MGEIQELKQNIGQAAENIIASGLNLEQVGKKYRCPNKVAHKHGDRNPSMSWDSKALQFYCFTCGTAIDIYGYYKDYLHYSHKQIMEELGMEKETINNVRHDDIKKDIPKFDIKVLTKDCIKYFHSRKLSDETLKYFRIGSFQENPAIPYHLNGQVTGVKIRNLKNTSPKYFSMTGSQFGLFNKQNIADTSQLIITEGEIDCMTVHQCGYVNVVSVGTGANSLNKLFKQEKAFLNKFSSLVVLGDNDKTGSKMDTAFLDEFGYKVKLPNKNLYKGRKDLNEVYLSFGEKGVNAIINSAFKKIEGLRDLDLDPYEGVEALDGKYIPTGLPTIDFALNDLAPGLVTLVTGRANGGKSTLINQVMANAIDKGNKVLLIAGEGLQEILINNLYKAVVGRNEEYFEYKQINKRKFKEPKKKVLKALQQWHKDKLVLFSKGDSNLKTTGELFDLLNVEIKTNRHDLVVIDNLMSVLSVEKASEKLEAQGDFMQRCCDLAKSEGIHICLVLHPNKTISKNSEMEFEQISGTLDLPNKADNIIVVKREYDEEKINQSMNGEIEVLKNRYFSDLPKIDTHYDEETGLLLEISETSDYLAYTFGWRRYLEGEQEYLYIPDEFHEIIT